MLSWAYSASGEGRAAIISMAIWDSTLKPGYLAAGKWVICDR